MLEVTTTNAQGRIPVTILHFKGDLDSVGSEIFENSYSAAYEAGARAFLLDLSKLNFVSSVGIRAFHRLFYKLHPEGSEEYKRILDEGVGKGTYKAPYMKLLNPSKRVQDVINMVGMDMYIDVLSSGIDAAVQKF
jgi:anti-anti-sigma factor